MFEPDFLIHFAGSAALFLLMWLVFGRGILRPFFEIVEERERKTTGAEALAHRKREDLRKLEQDLKQALLDARLRGLAERDKIVHRAKLESQEARQRALQISAGELAQARRDADELKLQNLSEMESEVEALSQLLMSQVVQRPAGRVLH